MTALLIGLIAVLALTLGAVAARYRSYRAGQASAGPAGSARRIVFPFVASALSKRALDAALPRQSTIAITLQEAIEQRATAFGVPVDARIERGRTHRHALRQTITNERFERMVIAAAAHDSPGFNPEDVAWLLANAPGEIVVLRPSSREEPWIEPVRRPHRRPAFVARGDSHPPASWARHLTLARR